MKCPKCDEGTLVKTKFKASDRISYSCDFCEALWFDDEIIASTTGHTLSVYSEGKEHEIKELDEDDQDHRPVRSIRYL